VIVGGRNNGDHYFGLNEVYNFFDTDLPGVGEIAWHVRLNDDGSLYWYNSDETVTEQPARDGMQRVMNVLMKLGPVDSSEVRAT
jgi:hypothetical protein